MIRFSFATLLLIMLCGCGSKPAYEKRVIFPNNSWQRFNILKFSFDNNKVGREGNVSMKLYVTEDVRWTFIPIIFKITSPSDDERTQEYNFWLRGSDGNMSGEKVDNIYEYIFPLREGYIFNEKGTYTISIENKMYKYDNEGFVKMDLVIE